jgi:hypothetical protein
MLTGTVFGAWQMCRAALAVTGDDGNNSCNKGDVSPEFANNKVSTTRFYCQQVLPRAAAYLQMIEVTAESVFSIPVDQL